MQRRTFLATTGLVLSPVPAVAAPVKAPRERLGSYLTRTFGRVLADLPGFELVAADDAEHLAWDVYWIDAETGQHRHRLWGTKWSKVDWLLEEDTRFAQGIIRKALETLEAREQMTTCMAYKGRMCRQSLQQAKVIAKDTDVEALLVLKEYRRRYEGLDLQGLWRAGVRHTSLVVVNAEGQVSGTVATEDDREALQALQEQVDLALQDPDHQIFVNFEATFLSPSMAHRVHTFVGESAEDMDRRVADYEASL